MIWEVKTFTLCEGWVNTWTVCKHGQEPAPETFETREEAEAALADFLQDIAYAAARGDIEEPEDPANYAICPVEIYARAS